jgi:GNAT superfamily N-acetyltransferase
MEFEEVNLDKSLDLYLEFRRDTYFLSYESDNEFNVQECVNWFKSLKENNPTGFKHVLLNGEIIGLLEYKSGIKELNGELTGYINLIYLLPEYRRKKFGIELQNHILSKFISDGCSFAYLRYLPKNVFAGSFYKKHGWKPEGVLTERGQLMVKKLA